MVVEIVIIAVVRSFSYCNNTNNDDNNSTMITMTSSGYCKPRDEQRSHIDMPFFPCSIILLHVVEIHTWTPSPIQNLGITFLLRMSVSSYNTSPLISTKEYAIPNVCEFSITNLFLAQNHNKTRDELHNQTLCVVSMSTQLWCPSG